MSWVWGLPSVSVPAQVQVQRQPKEDGSFFPVMGLLWKSGVRGMFLLEEGKAR